MREQTELEKAIATMESACDICANKKYWLGGNNSSVIKTVVKPPICKTCITKSGRVNFELAEKYKGRE